MTETIRAFIAVPLPEAITQHLGQVSQQLDQSLPRRAVRWVKPDRMHLTLRFLGETAVSQLDPIAQQLDALAAAHASFTMQLGSLGCFPNARRPRVIWTGLEGEEKRLQALKQDLDARLAPLGWEVEKRPFSAHLTLGRVKDRRKVKSLDLGLAVDSLLLPVTAVHLIQSDLRPAGPVYTVQHRAQLRP